MGTKHLTIIVKKKKRISVLWENVTQQLIQQEEIGEFESGKEGKKDIKYKSWFNN